ncbi:MAG TPA: hypothetical protein VGX23_11925 [Actinocrinis sp.]|nr:hypothetical protein [Actinocrinis sp.]
MADYYVFKMPKNSKNNGELDKSQVVELVALAAAVAGTDKVIYLSGPHANPEQKAAMKAVRNQLVSKGVPMERITHSKPDGMAVHLADAGSAAAPASAARV